MDISEKIRLLRMQKGFSQEELAEKIGVSRQSVSKWESGQAAPETGKLLILAETLGVTTDQLLDPRIKNFDKEKASDARSSQTKQHEYDRRKYAKNYLIGRDIFLTSLIVLITCIVISVIVALISSDIALAAIMMLPLVVLLVQIAFAVMIVGLVIMFYSKSKLKQMHFDGIDSSNWAVDVRNEKGKIKMSRAAKIVIAAFIILMAASVIFPLSGIGANEADDMNVGLISFTPTFFMNFLFIGIIVAIITVIVIAIVKSLSRK